MRYLTLIGFAICRFSFAQIATSPMSLSNAATTYLPQQINTQPIQFNESPGSTISLANEWMVTGTDLRNSQLSFAHQFNNSKLSAYFNHEGSSDFSNNGLTLNLGQKINSHLILGVGFNGQKSQQNIAQDFQIGYNLFGSYQLNKNTTVCIWHQKIDSKTYQSIAYNYILNNTIFSGAIAVTENSPVLEIGSNYILNNKLIFGAMISNGPYPFGGSLHYLYNQWAITFKVAYHQNQLGFRPTIYIYYAFKEQKSGGSGVGNDVHKPLRSN